MLSILMSIYYKENPNYFNQAMESIWDSQTVKPDEIILVEDGKLSEELYKVIKVWKEKLTDTLKVISLAKNIGTGGAKREGLKHCRGDFIAIMDTDDISEPERFEKQLDFFKHNSEVDAIGTWISEIDEHNNVTRSVVKYPTNNEELYNFFSVRDPIPHMTSMFRRRFFVEKKVGYLSEVKMAEDTLLWYQAYKSNCILANVPYVGVKVRTISNLFHRRGDLVKSIQLLKFRLFKINRELKYGFRADLYAIVYFMMSLSPAFVKKWLYKNFR